MFTRIINITAHKFDRTSCFVFKPLKKNENAPGEQSQVGNSCHTSLALSLRIAKTVSNTRAQHMLSRALFPKLFGVAAPYGREI